MKRTIRLKESELKKMIAESVKRVMNEGQSFPIDPSDLARELFNNNSDFNLFVHYLEKTYEMLQADKQSDYNNNDNIDNRCSYNKECIEAFDMMTSERIGNYLNGKGFKQIHKDKEMEIWEKGDTRVIFDGYDDNQYGYMTTEYLG